MRRKRGKVLSLMKKVLLKFFTAFALSAIIYEVSVVLYLARPLFDSEIFGVHIDDIFYLGAEAAFLFGSVYFSWYMHNYFGNRGKSTLLMIIILTICTLTYHYSTLDSKMQKESDSFASYFLLKYLNFIQ